MGSEIKKTKREKIQLNVLRKNKSKKNFGYKSAAMFVLIYEKIMRAKIIFYAEEVGHY